MRLKLWLCLIGFALALAGTGPALAGKRVALVIGNDAYRNVPALRKAVNDARTMAESLKGLGFTVIGGENLTQRSMSETLLAFDRAIEPGDTALLFFAGHGFEIRRLNYLLPIDVPAATEGQEELVRDASFAVDRLVERVQARGAATAILVLDACRNNPFERPGKRSVGGSPGLAPMTPPDGVFVIYSAGVKQEALDRLSDTDPDPNSVFTRHFAKELARPGLSLVQLAKRTQAEVRRAAASARHEQTPAYYDQIVGDFVLNGQAADLKDLPPVAAAPAPAPNLQVAALPPPVNPALAPRTAAPDPGNAPVNGPIVNFTRSSSGWHGTISLPEPAIGLSWRLGEGGPFQETGLLDAIDQRTGRRMPNPSFQLDADTPAGTVYVRYLDPGGLQVGPFPIAFEPASALVREQRKMIDMVSGSWLSFRDFNGVLVYYTTLVSYRCAIKELRIGIDKPAPDRVVALPPCDEANPFAIPDRFLPYMKLPGGTKSVSAQIQFQDGTTSPVKVFRR